MLTFDFRSSNMCSGLPPPLDITIQSSLAGRPVAMESPMIRCLGIDGRGAGEGAGRTVGERGRRAGGTVGAGGGGAVGGGAGGAVNSSVRGGEDGSSVVRGGSSSSVEGWLLGR